MALLTSGGGWRYFVHGINQRLMIGEGDEGSSLEHVAEMADSRVESEQLAVEGAVARLCRLQLAAVEREWLPNPADPLLEHGTKTDIRSV
jgi:hypothetical protein